MHPIRILHVFGRVDRGGAETMIMNLYRNIDKSLIQFDFAVHTNDICDYEEEIMGLGGKIYRLPQFNGINIINYINAWRNFFKIHQEYKIIHGHMYSIASIYLLIAKSYGLYTIAHSHSTSNGSGIKSIVKDIFCLPLKYICDYKMACGIDAAKWLFGEKRIRENSFHLLKNAINLEEYFCKDEMNESLSNKERIVCGHIGRFVEVKNHRFLVDVFFEYHKLNPNSILLLIGTGELEDIIKEYVVKLRLEKTVFFLGNQKNVKKHLRKMDVFIFPSIYEGLPLALVEAQASGIQCFISDTISDEVCITSCINKLSLKESASVWARCIKGKNLMKKNTHSELRNAGYDIENTVQWLSKFYINHYKLR